MINSDKEPVQNVDETIANMHSKAPGYWKQLLMHLKGEDSNKK